MLFRSLVAAFGLGLALEVVASPLLRDKAPGKRDVPNTHTLHERHKPRITQHWTKRERLSPKTVLPMRIGLKQRNLDAGHTRLMEMLVIHLDRSIRVTLTFRVQFYPRFYPLRQTHDLGGDYRLLCSCAIQCGCRHQLDRVFRH